MTAQQIITLVGGILLIVLCVLVGRKVARRRHRSTVGPGLIGALWELQSDEKRQAVELIVEQRAEERRPEYPDGNLPDLEDPKRPGLSNS